MAATRDDIQRWIDSGIEDGARWMIVVCDSFDYEDYPVYAETVAEFDLAYDAHNGKNMQRIMEVYDLRGDIQEQMRMRRAWCYPTHSQYNPNKPEDADPLIEWMGTKGE